jgi:archaeosine synthase
MTKYFEVTKRDAAARIGRLMLDKQYQTPLILHAGAKSPIVYAGTLWARDTMSTDQVESSKLVILPDKPMPLHLEQNKVKKILQSCTAGQQAWEDWDGALGRIIHPAMQDFSPADLYVLGASGQFENNARALVDTVIKVRNNTLPDTALYAPALATPENLALLVYLGIDIVDDTLPVLKGFNDIYMTPFSEHKYFEMTQLPCRCNICSNTSIEALQELNAPKRYELIARHNINKLEEERSITVQYIRNGNLREYIEGKCRSRPWLVALLRLLDQESSYLARNTPTFRSRTMYANSSEALHRSEVITFNKRVRSRYQAPDADILLLLPCSARKPYSISHSHWLFSRALGSNKRTLNEVVITSPLGIVPKELELIYPAAHYDIPVTGHWDCQEREWVGECLCDYLQKNNYSHIIAHVDAAYKEICRNAADTLDLDIIYTACGNVTSDKSLQLLGSTINTIVEAEQYKPRKPAQMKKDILTATADYQFGTGAGHILVPVNALIKGSYPKYRIYDGDVQLAALEPRTGALIPTLDGAVRLLELKTYQVKIDDFIPKGSLLAPGVLDADPVIRPSDQVIVINERILAVGRAQMSGPEMVLSTRGVAVDLRQVKEI